MKDMLKAESSTMSSIERHLPTHPISTDWVLHDLEQPVRRIVSSEELARVIRNLPDSGSPPNRIVELETPEGGVLSLGLAGCGDSDNPGLTQKLGYAQFVHATFDPPYLVPVGDSSLTYEKDGVVVFRFQGTWTEISRRNCVSLEILIQMVQDFYQSGILPEWIAWEEV